MASPPLPVCFVLDGCGAENRTRVLLPPMATHSGSANQTFALSSHATSSSVTPSIVSFLSTPSRPIPSTSPQVSRTSLETTSQHQILNFPDQMSSVAPSPSAPAASTSAIAPVLRPCHCTSTGTIVGITIAAASTESVLTMLVLLYLLRRNGRFASMNPARPMTGTSVSLTHATVSGIYPSYLVATRTLPHIEELEPFVIKYPRYSDPDLARSRNAASLYRCRSPQIFRLALLPGLWQYVPPSPPFCSAICVLVLTHTRRRPAVHIPTEKLRPSAARDRPQPATPRALPVVARVRAQAPSIPPVLAAATSAVAFIHVPRLGIRGWVAHGRTHRVEGTDTICQRHWQIHGIRSERASQSDRGRRRRGRRSASEDDTCTPCQWSDSSSVAARRSWQVRGGWEAPAEVPSTDVAGAECHPSTCG